MRRLRKSHYRSTKADRACLKKSTKSKVRGCLDDLPPVEVVFPFLYFQPEFDLFADKNVTHGSSHPSELDISSFPAKDSFEIQENLFCFPIYSQDDWIWLGDDGYDAPPLEFLCGALYSNEKDGYDAPPLEPICGVFPTNSIDFDQFMEQEPVHFSSNAYPYGEIDKCDYRKKVRFADQESKQTKRKTEPDEYSMYENSRKKANISREPALERSSLVSNRQSHTSVERSSKISNNSAQNCVQSKDSVLPKTIPLKETSKSIECIRFNNAADILAIASAMSKSESKFPASNNNKDLAIATPVSKSESKFSASNNSKDLAIASAVLKSESKFTASNNSKNLAIASVLSKSESKFTASNKDQVTSQSSSSSRKVERKFSMPEVQETYSEPPVADYDIPQENRMMKNLSISPKSEPSKNFNIDSAKTENYFFASHPCSSKKGEKQNDSSGVPSKVKSGVIEKEDEDRQPRRSTRIHLRQCRGKQNNLIEPLWIAETEWWVKP